MKLLFVCSRNQWRSPTAEKIFRSQFHATKSAGTATSAKTKINANLINWADQIFVMEYRHRQILNEKFGCLLQHKQMVVLDIPDEYEFMDDELIVMLQIAVEPYLTEL